MGNWKEKMKKLKLKLPSKLQVEYAKTDKNWKFSNDQLYKLCSENFSHKNIEVIMTKVLFIGRVYSAAVERRKKNLDLNNDDFYRCKIAPIFQKNDFELNLENLRKNKYNQKEKIEAIISLHHYLSDSLFKKTNLYKKSFSSKYLHFHLPDFFCIYDARANSTLKTFGITLEAEEIEFLKRFKGTKQNVDYPIFLFKCNSLISQIMKEYRVKLTYRELDNLLLQTANKKIATVRSLKKEN